MQIASRHCFVCGTSNQQVMTASAGFALGVRGRRGAVRSSLSSRPATRHGFGSYSRKLQNPHHVFSQNWLRGRSGAPTPRSCTLPRVPPAAWSPSGQGWCSLPCAHPSRREATQLRGEKTISLFTPTQRFPKRGNCNRPSRESCRACDLIRAASDLTCLQLCWRTSQAWNMYLLWLHF